MAIILFALLQSRNEVWKPVAWIYFEIRFALLLSWPILGPKMMTSLNSGGNISIRASVHLCKFVISSQGYQKCSKRFFYIYFKASWKNVITFWSHIASSFVYIHWYISIDSSFFSRDYISSFRFLRGIHNIFGCFVFT